MNESTPKSYRIPECNIPELEEKIEKLAKRATKLRLDPPRLVVGEFEDVPLVVKKLSRPRHPSRSRRWTRSTTRSSEQHHYNVTLTGEAPTIPGWKLVAVIEEKNSGDTDLGNVLRVAPDMECPAEYRKAAPHCDQLRGTSKAVGDLRPAQPEGAYKQIGRGIAWLTTAALQKQPTNYAATPRFWRASAVCARGSRTTTSSGWGDRPSTVPGRGYPGPARVIRHCGWTSRKKAREMDDGKEATANTIEAAMFDPSLWTVDRNTSNERKALQAACRDVQAQDTELAEAALVWIRSMRSEAETLGDYLYNALVVASEETAGSGSTSASSSVVSSYQRSLEQAEERKRQERMKEESDHFGVEKGRGRWEATVMGVKQFEGDSYGYGDEPTVRYLYRLAVQDRHIAIWWTGKEYIVKPGEKVVVVGTVKKHSEFKGTKQTELTRCDLYTDKEQGKCPNCGDKVLTCDKGKNCPSCKKRGLKVKDDWFTTDLLLAQPGSYPWEPTIRRRT